MAQNWWKIASDWFDDKEKWIAFQNRKTKRESNRQTNKLESSEDEIAENITDPVDQIRSDPH